MVKLRPGQSNPKASTQASLSEIAKFALLFVFVVHVYAKTNPNESQQNPPVLTKLDLAKPVECEIAGGQSNNYQIDLVAGQYVRVKIDQRGIDLVLKLLGPDGKSIADFDDEDRLNGQENAELVVGPTGTYTLRVAAKYRHVPSANYVIQVVELREANDKDRLAQQLRDQGSNVTNLYRRGKYDEAFALAESLLGEIEKSGNAESRQMGLTLNRLGGICHAKGDYTNAETYFQRSLVVLEKRLGPDDPDVLRVFFNLGLLYKDKGNYAKAEEFHQKALTGRERVLGADSPDVAASLTNFATIYRVKGDYARAEEMQLKALAIWEKIQGPDDDDVGLVLYNLGALYYVKKDFAKAAEVTERALQIRQKTLGADHPDVGRILNNLAVIYNEVGDYTRAEAAILRSVSLSEKALGPDSVRLTPQLDNLAELYEIKEEYAKAEALYQRVLKIQESSLSPDHPEIARTFVNLASIYYLEGEYAKAEPLYQRALATREKVLGPEHPDVAETLNDMARLYEAKGDIGQALTYQKRANALVERENELKLFAGSQSQLLAYFDSLAQQTDQTISLHVRLARDDHEACNLAATTILQRKGRVQDEIAGSLASVQRQMGSDGKALLEQLNEITARLAKLVLSGASVKVSTDEHQKQVKQLEEQREAIESEISHRSAGFYEPSQTITLEAVQSAIPDDAALIEFAVYRPLLRRVGDKQKAYGEARYVAYVIHHQGKVNWQELGPCAEIDARVASLRRALSDRRSTDVLQTATAVDLKTMRPLREFIGSASHLLISPDGQLNLIPFAALPDGQGHYLVESKTITYLTSGRDLLRLQVSRASKGPPVILADPAYGDPPLIAERESSHRDGSQSSNPVRIDYSQIYFGPLPGVNDEVRALRKLLPNAIFLTGEEATKSALQSIVAPSILHIATHGFFLSGPEEGTTRGSGAVRGINANATIEDPLLRSGLALAGANRRDESGILTALEASGLNLWGTKLVVLSACDTGIGQVRNGEGVYGLRRSLVLAGAETQLMSLWPVSDRATRDLMIGYYKDLVSGQGRGEALRQVQLQMLRDKIHSHPYYWASFIQTGEWANLDSKR